MVLQAINSPRKMLPRLLGTALMVGALGSGCSWMPQSVAQSGPRERGDDQPVAVETQVVTTGSVEDALEYTGTTRPAQSVTLRAQVEGQVIDLFADAGDAVGSGEVLARLDPNLLTVGVNQSQAELAARQAEVAQAQTGVSDAQTAVDQAQLQVEQARIEANRLRQLADAGAVSLQDAEQAQLVLNTAQKALQSAQEQVRTRQQAVNATRGRVDSQRAVVAQSQERLAFATVRSPLSGIVLGRLVEPGDFAQTGAELLQIGDLSTIKITVEVSELNLSSISRGQPVEVRLDAFPDLTATGQVTRITPVADTTSRLLPVEVTIPNPQGRIGSGLLARLRFLGQRSDAVVVPTEALQGEPPTLFVVQDRDSDAPKVVARSVELGDRSNGQVAILSGLNPGEQVVVRSDRPLEDGQTVRLSILSDPQ
ncbi:efflux RND transporter periplasmic adaptor subunit [Leptolyngbya sp. PCC 6406]|uniref:efflux RND transporter periplasmic adaptor subunit n=1 Tax=Leptolyngbya sp. PCC 6406 TaxID=1173264 RepID=UPI0002ABA0B7|nr:efflux RND transporter periplasmic adaptor subunit [Leptolyngbya sp. PCC 6406]